LASTRTPGMNLALAAGAILLLVIAILEVPRLLKHDPDARPAANLSSESSASAAPSAPPSSTASEAAVKSAAPSRDASRAKSENPKPEQAAKKPEPHPVAAPAATPPESAQPVAVKSSSSPSSSAVVANAGEITHQAIPDIPQKSLDTIHGTVRVAVRVKVDDSGKVSDASFDSPGPSQYFARIAMKSAQEWTFSPSTAAQSAPRQWVLHFQFTRDGTKVIPSSAAPK
ncbi:MAG TPA: energy transducer TonB, partial [Candidatus Acidoferrales bacterium]|nr:energy transducer TonB [Candidatus Acidoferrales bacterium]